MVTLIESIVQNVLRGNSMMEGCVYLFEYELVKLNNW